MKKSNWQVTSILHFYAPKSILLARVLRRAETSGRVDDTAEVFAKRLAAHEAEIESVLGAFEGKVKNVSEKFVKAFLDVLFLRIEITTKDAG